MQAFTLNANNAIASALVERAAHGLAHSGYTLHEINTMLQIARIYRLDERAGLIAQYSLCSNTLNAAIDEIISDAGVERTVYADV